MSMAFRVDLGFPALLEFRGPDAVRFLNGQMTQDVKRLDAVRSPSSCVTDAKGKLQFRVYLTEAKPGVVWVTMPGVNAEDLEARLTRYLIADDVEVTDRTGEFRLVHVIGMEPKAKADWIARKAVRFGAEGTDLWIPADDAAEFSGGPDEVPAEELEAFRIAHGAPGWGSELREGMLPPEANLEASDISYHKGCYIGQEVISRIKSAGKVNRSLVKVVLPEDAPAKAGDGLFSGEDAAGELTSVSPLPEDGRRLALGYVKRTAEREGLRLKCGEALYDVVIVD